MTSHGPGGRHLFLRNRIALVELSDAEKVDWNAEIKHSGQGQDFAWSDWRVAREIRDRSLENHHLLAAMGFMV